MGLFDAILRKGQPEECCHKAYAQTAPYICTPVNGHEFCQTKGMHMNFNPHGYNGFDGNTYDFLNSW